MCRIYICLPTFQVQKAGDEFARYYKTTKVIEDLYVLVAHSFPM